MDEATTQLRRIDPAQPPYGDQPSYGDQAPYGNQTPYGHQAPYGDRNGHQQPYAQQYPQGYADQRYDGGRDDGRQPYNPGY